MLSVLWPKFIITSLTSNSYSNQKFISKQFLFYIGSLTNIHTKKQNPCSGMPRVNNSWIWIQSNTLPPHFPPFRGLTFLFNSNMLPRSIILPPSLSLLHFTHWILLKVFLLKRYTIFLSFIFYILNLILGYYVYKYSELSTLITIFLIIKMLYFICLALSFLGFFLKCVEHSGIPTSGL